MEMKAWPFWVWALPVLCAVDLRSLPPTQVRGECGDLVGSKPGAWLMPSCREY